MQKVTDYIKKNWDVLKRDHKGLLTQIKDPKFPGSLRLYIPVTDNFDEVVKKLSKELSADDFSRIEIKTLDIEKDDIDKTGEHGLLYLPYPYVVPGGRFNEMYGWDSYFILLGLIEDGFIELARDMTDNFVYQVRHYGKILNANRTYYLKRSQPPFLSAMAMAVYEETKDKKWLESIFPEIKAFYDYWTSGDKLNRETGLSRYYAEGHGPVIEVLKSGDDADYFENVRDFFAEKSMVSDFFDGKNLTNVFFKADRSVRESGFDLSDMFGNFGSEINNYVPVCLNTLLYVMEKDIANICVELGKEEESIDWQKRAEKRASLISRYMWDEDEGLYFNYNFVKQERRIYPFATTFYPLWAGIASKDKAKRILDNLDVFEKAGGIVCSPYITKQQWDSPFGWAPLQYFAVKGLSLYGFDEHAKNIAGKWVKLIDEMFSEHGAIYEKYNVVDASAKGNIEFGYRSNEIGFGWTNAVYLELLKYL